MGHRHQVSPSHPILIAALLLFWPVSQRVPLNKVAPQNLAEPLIEIELAKIEIECKALINWA